MTTKKINVTDYLSTEYSSAALYRNFRNTPGIDGLKNSMRKVVFTLKKKNIKEPMKVSALGSEVVKEAEYLHGDAAIQGTIITMSKSYCGSNNLPVLEGIGGFGTRFTPEASAPRYIFVKPAPYFNELFKPEDDVNFKLQFFEGKEIEPIYYAPTLPLLLVNGSEGIGVGFASMIFPRSVENVFKMVRAKLEGKNIKKEWFKPYWKGFKGTVDSENGSWVVKGIMEMKGNRKVLITEIPMTWTLSKYIKNLQSCKEKGIIQSYSDYSEDDSFKFEVKLTEEEAKKSQEQICKDLGLVKSMKETLTVIDEKNAIKEYSDPKDIFEDYFKLKMESLNARLKSEIQRLTEEDKMLEETFKFIMDVINEKVNIKLKRSEVEKLLKSLKYTQIDKLLSLPLYSLTEDKAKELEKKWKEKTKELEAMKKETPKTLWLRDLVILEKKLENL